MKHSSNTDHENTPLLFIVVALVALAASQSGRLLVYSLEGIQGRINENSYLFHTNIDNMLGVIAPHQVEIGIATSIIILVTLLGCIPMVRGLQRKRKKQRIDAIRARRRLRR